MEAAIAAVEEGKNITEQAQVDDMAKAIEDAIAALEKKEPEEEDETLTKPEETKPTETKPAETKPETGDGKTDGSATPPTGDNKNIALWASLAAVSGIAAAALTFNRQKKCDK